MNDFKRNPPIIEICMENAICNMRCKYCFGGFDGNHNNHTGKVPEFNASLLDKALRYVSPSYRGGIKIWGGEPLANWETFKKVAEYARSKFPEANLILITNGSLLNKEKAKFLSEMRFHVNISHDGAGQSLRGKDYLVAGTEQVDAIRYLKLNGSFSSFHMVIHRESCDLDKQIDYWTNVSENILEFPFQVSWSIFRATDDWTDEFMPDMDKHNEFFDYTFGQMIDKYKGCLKSRVLFGFSTDQERAMRTFVFGQKAEYPCSTFDSITVGLSGQLYRCVQDCERRSAGESSELYAQLLDRKSFHLLPECEECDVRDMCAGMCAILTDEQRKKNCANYQNFLRYMRDYLFSDRQRFELIARSMGAVPAEEARARMQMQQRQLNDHQVYYTDDGIKLEEHSVDECSSGNTEKKCCKCEQEKDSVTTSDTEK